MLPVLCLLRNSRLSLMAGFQVSKTGCGIQGLDAVRLYGLGALTSFSSAWDSVVGQIGWALSEGSWWVKSFEGSLGCAAPGL